jgi:hypothetical protein
VSSPIEQESGNPPGNRKCLRCGPGRTLLVFDRLNLEGLTFALSVSTYGTYGQADGFLGRRTPLTLTVVAANALPTAQAASSSRQIRADGDCFRKMRDAI